MSHCARCTLLALLIGFTVLMIGERARAGDPYLEWYTVETPHFRIDYHSGLAEQAQEVANLAEVIHQRLVPETRWEPKHAVHIVLTDDTDSANGSARVVPSKIVRMFITSPEDMSPLNDFDDWPVLLLTHEYTHVLHMDNITGLPALVNAILGRTYAPNQAQPKWITEGWPVYLESKYTGGGRLRSSLADMYLRADVLAGRVKSLDKISGDPRRWPGGAAWYLYGGAFLAWISDTYGEDTMAAVSADYGRNILAWGINRSMRRVTGLTYPELWKGWVHHLETRYREQMATVERRGLREGTRLTHRGGTAASPRFVPVCARHEGREAVLYYSSDAHSTGGFYSLALSGRNRVIGGAQLEVRSQGSIASYDPECNLYHDDVAPSRREYRFLDLFRQPRGTRSPHGIEGTRQRLTIGRRAAQPDVSPDGRHVTYVTNRAGTTTLRIADRDPDGSLINERILVPSARYEQAYTPRFSPDGRHVAYSAWTRGGYRDVRVVEVATGRFYEISRDRAMDQQPSWSSDGRTLYFTSDRTGIPNVYAFDVITRQLSQVTNVRTGAYMPEVTPDGETLFYVGYTYEGFDIYSMPLDRDQWLSASPYLGERPGAHPQAAAERYPTQRYRPRKTLRPYAYEYEFGPSTFGNALILTTSGSDAVGLHYFAASVTVDTEEGLPSTRFAYAYRGLPFEFNLQGFRNAAPRTSYELGDRSPRFIEYSTGISTGIVLPLPRVFDAQSISLTYSAARLDAKLPVRGLEDPYALVAIEPYRGFFASASASYSYSNIHSNTYSISNERGYAVSLDAEYAGPETGSESTLISLIGHARAFVPLPWARHHVLATALSAGTAAGSYARRGVFFTGGFVESPLVEALRQGQSASGFVLRGYEPTQYIGNQYTLVNGEYRFPIVYADRGVSTLPLFLRSIAGNLFVDYGGAFDQLDLHRPLDSLQLGLGGELWFDVIAGYATAGHFRLGYARGTDSEAIDGGQLYLVVSGSF